MAAIVTQEEQPISRTYQYRKVMKPMLERKRRARINRCLDELKELLVGALQAEGESVSRLEKADVLELTVRHLHKLRRSQQLSESSAGDRFRAGFVHCANEVSKYMTTMTTNTIDISVSSRLVSHLDQYIRHIENSTGVANHHHAHHAQLSPPLSSGGGNTNYGTPISVVSSQNSPTGMNILTTYTPPTSPISSPANNANNGKLFAFIPSSSASSNSSACSAGSLSPIPPAHFHSQQIYGPPNGGGMPQPLSLCMKEEPFDLSNNVWRPW